MPSVWLISDTHFGHEKTCTVFKREDGSPMRPFSSAGEMDEYMVEAWNARVKPNDKIYHLGDVVISRKNLKILSKLNGDKILIRGNHDIFKLSDYTEYFRDIRSYHVMNGMILSHIPVHNESLGRFGCNIHGHLHVNNIPDIRYHNVCVEHTEYAPILFEEVCAKIKSEGGTVGFKLTRTIE
jgi:calcineurin-like phosphoesterase family protein